MTAVFLPDLLWIALARAGIEPEYSPRTFLHDWSHSVFVILLWSTVFTLAFWKKGWIVALAVWIAGVSHLALDFLIHPARLALYPHASARLGWDLWTWGQMKSRLGPSHYWWIETSWIAVLLEVYVLSPKDRLYTGRVGAAPCLLIAGLHLLSI